MRLLVARTDLLQRERVQACASSLRGDWVGWLQAAHEEISATASIYQYIYANFEQQLQLLSACLFQRRILIESP
eukprot:13378-Heterococcus_DN1.PRE.3